MDASEPLNLMDTAPGIITLTTDFGTSDVYVGSMKGVILSINRHVRIVDLTHAISAQDIPEAAFSIAAAYPYFPKGTVHVIVVDPGVGSERGALVCAVADSFFVCPDNGVLSHIFAAVGHEGETVSIENSAYVLPAVSNTFHGRDIFAPVAAHLSLGVPLNAIGPPLESPVRLPVETPELAGNTVTGRIVKIDRFGNAITNISESALAAFTGSARGAVPRYEIRVAGVRLHRLNRAYAESAGGAPVAIIGSFKALEIAINGGSAEAALGLKRGDPVVVERFV